MAKRKKEKQTKNGLQNTMQKIFEKD